MKSVEAVGKNIEQAIENAVGALKEAIKSDFDRAMNKYNQEVPLNLFEKLQNNNVTPLLERGKGHFVVDDNNGIALLVASSYKNKKASSKIKKGRKIKYI